MAIENTVDEQRRRIPALYAFILAVLLAQLSNQSLHRLTLLPLENSVMVPSSNVTRKVNKFDSIANASVVALSSTAPTTISEALSVDISTLPGLQVHYVHNDSTIGECNSTLVTQFFSIGDTKHASSKYDLWIRNVMTL